MFLKKCDRTGKYQDGSPRSYFVWCIFIFEDDYKPFMEFAEDVDENYVQHIFAAVNAVQPKKKYSFSIYQEREINEESDTVPYWVRISRNLDGYTITFSNEEGWGVRRTFATFLGEEHILELGDFGIEIQYEDWKREGNIVTIWN